MTVITRFAPSPTGFLHIGGARTALFNWLYAKHHNGQFRLRIEDTDRARSTDEAIAAILDGMKWLGLNWDDKEIYQFSRAGRHAEIANRLLAEGKAYRCYCTQAELDEMRAQAQAEKKGFRYDGRWRDRDPNQAPEGVLPVIRLKVPQEGEILIKDQVQGDVRINTRELDDMIILRSDGTPVYMLAVVVDDHDMGITHVIRGDDHLTNAAKQILIYQAMGWQVPVFAHVPMIHGADGAKLSKRHGALGVEAYRDMGYLPEALRNYLLRLGWAHGNDEIISTEQAIAWFSLEGIGKSPSRFDLAKLENLNGHYIREAADIRLVDLILPLIEKSLNSPISLVGRERLLAAMNGLKQRARTLLELADNAAFYVQERPLKLTDKAKALLNEEGKSLLRSIIPLLENSPGWNEHSLQELVRTYTESNGQKLGKLAQPLRAALTGRDVSPSIFEIMQVLGKRESLARLLDSLE